MARAPRIEAELLSELGARVGAHAGLALPEWVLEARVRERIAALGVDGRDYLALIGSSEGRRELELLIETLRVGETRFFRHRSHVKALTDVVLPALRGAAAVRAWSAGSA